MRGGKGVGVGEESEKCSFYSLLNSFITCTL